MMSTFPSPTIAVPLEASRGVAASLYNKVTGSLSICLSVCLSVCTNKDLANCCTDKVLLYNSASPGKVHNYFGGGYYHPHKRNRP